MKRLLRDWRTHVGLASLGLLLAFLICGPIGLQGMALGLIGTGVVIGGTAGVVTILTRAARNEGVSPALGILVVIGFLTMLPIFFVTVWMVRSLPDPGPPCYLAGMALVYCALIGWAQSAR